MSKLESPTGRLGVFETLTPALWHGRTKTSCILLETHGVEIRVSGGSHTEARAPRMYQEADYSSGQRRSIVLSAMLY